MQSINEAVSAFLASKPVAVTGVFRTPKTNGSNNVNQRLRERGYQVFEVNLNTGQVEGDRCYRDPAVVRRDAVALFRHAPADHARCGVRTADHRLAGRPRRAGRTGRARAWPGRRGLASRPEANAEGGCHVLSEDFELVAAHDGQQSRRRTG
jgi:CoA binding domain